MILDTSRMGIVAQYITTDTLPQIRYKTEGTTDHHGYGIKTTIELVIKYCRHHRKRMSFYWQINSFIHSFKKTS